MMADVEELLRRTMGLDASTIGTSSVERAVRVRMAHVGAATTEAYLQRLIASSDELDELIEAVVVPESWFFRDGTPFTALASWVRESWQPEHPGGTLRVLTIPCSTGEEPYSVAMTLLGAGMPPERFGVDAVDISRHALERAQRATYSSNSFRGPLLDFRERFFTTSPDGYVLADSVRQQVRFQQGNVLAHDFRPGVGRFDVIFCRNLLIYFDRPTQAKVLKRLGSLLAADGLLFVGHAETTLAATAGFTTANFPMAFAFRKPLPSAPLLDTYRPPMTPSVSRDKPRTRRVAVRTTLRLGAPLPPATRSLRVHTSRLPTPVGNPRFPAVPVSAPSPPPSSCADLAAARTLADQGKLEEATCLCEALLRQNGASASAWYLLGVVRDAAGDRPRALECYSKTLYLEPDHQEALLQRALLAEQSGDLATALQLRRRIARVQERTLRP